MKIKFGSGVDEMALDENGMEMIELGAAAGTTGFAGWRTEARRERKS